MGAELPWDGVPADGDSPREEGLAGGEAFAPDAGLPAGKDLAGCEGVGAREGPGGEYAVGVRDGLVARASAYPAASGTAHKPMTAILTAAPAPLDRKLAMVRHHAPLPGESSRACL